MTAEESAKTQEVIQAKEKESKALLSAQEESEAKVKEFSTKLIAMEAAKDAAEKVTEKEAERRRGAEARALLTAKIASIIVAILVSLTFMLLVHKIWRWDWLLSHPNSYGIQGCICLMGSFGIVGFWVRPWRKALWATGFFGAALAVLQILGGPPTNP